MLDGQKTLHQCLRRPEPGHQLRPRPLASRQRLPDRNRRRRVPCTLHRGRGAVPFTSLGSFILDDVVGRLHGAWRPRATEPAEAAGILSTTKRRRAAMTGTSSCIRWRRRCRHSTSVSSARPTAPQVDLLELTTVVFRLRLLNCRFTEGEGGNSNGIRLKEIKLLYCSC